MKAMLQTTAVLDRAVEARAFSAVTAEVGNTRSASWTYAAGQFGYDDDRRVTIGTIFDLASLTKVLCTTTLALPLIEGDTLRLETPVAAIAPQWTGADRARVTVRDLLEHCSGLPGVPPVLPDVCRSGRLRSRYCGRAARVSSTHPFDLQRSGLHPARFHHRGDDRRATRSPVREMARRRRHRSTPASSIRPNRRASTLPFTERDPWRGRLLQGEVHDENAAALGGVAGHAGLFGTAAAVGEAARWWLARLTGVDDPTTGISAAAVALCARRSSVPGSSRGLGWDTMLPTSSCGTRWSASAIGHTGFTGTSLWLDPGTDRYAVLLTNRVHPTRDNDRIQQVRRDFHDAVAADLEGTTERPTG